MNVREELHLLIDGLDGSAAKQQLHVLVNEMDEETAREPWRAYEMSIAA